MAVTRIKNNQITDATITYAKIANGTLVGSNFNPNLTLNSNVSIIGNLTVTGTSSAVSSTNTYVNDPLVVFNNGYTGSLSGYDIGILVNRNLATLSGYGSVNTAFIWSETDAAFIAVTTTDTGGGVTSINNSGFANVKVGNLTANSLTITTGSISAGSVSGQFTGNSAFTYETATNFSTGNASISGGNSAWTTLTATNLSTANASISGGNSAWTTLTATNFSTANASISGGNGAFTTLTATNLSSGNLASSNGQFSTLTATNFSTGNASISGGNGAFTTLTATNLSSGNITGTFNGTVATANVALYVSETATSTNQNYYIHLSDRSATSNTGVYVGSGITFNPSTNNLATTTFTGTFSGTASITSGSITGANGAFTTLTATNFSSANIANSNGAFTTLTTTNFSTGNASISGGDGAFATLTATNFSTGNASISGGSSAFTTLTATNFSSANISNSNGAFTTLTTTNFSTGNASISGGNGAFTTLTSTNLSSGNAVISGGSINGTSIGATSASTGKFTTIQGTSTTDATSTTTGAMTISGGVGIAGNLYVGGNIYAANIIATVQNQLVISDPLVYFQSTSPSPYNYDIGFFSDFVGGPVNVYGHSGVVRKQSANAWVFFSNIQTEPSPSSIAWNDTGIIYDAIIAGNIVAANTTSSTSTTTGALIVSGGAGIAGQVYAGGFNTSGGSVLGTATATNFSTGNASISGGNGAFTTLTSTNFSSGNIASSNGQFSTLTTTNFSTGNASISGGNGAFTTLTATNFSSGNIVGVLTGTASTANVSLYDSVTGTSTNTNYYIQLTDRSTTGNASAFVGSGITFNPSTNNLATTTFTGTFSGTASITSGSITGANGQFATLTATNFSSGNIASSNGQFSTLTTTNFSTGNARISGGYADAFPIGANTAATGAFTTLSTSGVSTLAGNVVITSGTDTINASGVGALVITGSGGASIASNVSIGNNLYVGGTNAFGQSLASAGIIVSKAGASYSQVALKNPTSTGSADFAAYGDTGTDTSGWSDMGFTGTGFNDTNYSITKPNDGYFIVRPVSNSYGGNLVLATSEGGSYNDVVIGVGSFLSTAEVARFHGNASNSGTFVLKLPTNAVPSANTGAMQVWGGTSISGNVYHGGATTMNGGQTAGADTIIKGKSDSTLIWAKSGASYDQVLIGNSAVMANLVTGAKLQINSTDSILLPVGTSAQRPGSSGGTDTTGMFRYNTTLNSIEYYGGSTPGWQQVTSQFTVIADDQFNGDGVTTGFTLTNSQTTNSCIVSINGVIQIPTLAYSVSGTTLTFTEAPASGDVIDVRKLTTTATVTQLASQNGYDVIAVDNTAGIQFYTGTSTQTLQYSMDTSGAWVTQRANVAVASANSATAIDSFAVATYRSAKYIIQATAAGKYQVMEALVVHDDTTPQIATFGVVQTNGNVGVLTATISAGTVSVNFIAANASTNVRVSKEYLIV